MTLQTRLQFGDNATENYNKEYLVVSYHNGVGRMYSAFTPQTTPKDTDIIVTLVSPSKDDLTLYEWFVNNSILSGRLLFDIVDVNSSDGIIQRSLYFYDAQCVAMKDTYDIHGKNRRQLTLTFTPAKIKIEEVTFTRDGSKDSQDDSTSDDDDVDMAKYNKQYDF